MGWSTGTSVCVDLWDRIREYIPEEDRAAILSEVIEVLTSYDWDLVNEIEEYWPESTEALNLYDPDIFDFNKEHLGTLLSDFDDDLY